MATSAKLKKFMFFHRIFAPISFCIFALPSIAQPSVVTSELDFVKHETHCAHYLGGEGFSDGVSFEYSQSLERALGNPSALDTSKLDQMKLDCIAELTSRSRFKQAASKAISAKQAE